MEVFPSKSDHAFHYPELLWLSFSLKDFTMHVIFAVYVGFSGLSLTIGLTLTHPSSQNAVRSRSKAEPRGRPGHQGEATQRHFQGWRHRTRALKVFHKMNKRPPFVGLRQWSRTERLSVTDGDAWKLIRSEDYLSISGIQLNWWFSTVSPCRGVEGFAVCFWG